MSFTNITDEELVGMGVTGLPDTPGLTTEEMQAQFDEYSVFLKDKFKGLIAELEAATAALNIGADVPENITAEGNIQSILEGLRQYVDDTVVAIGTSDMATAIYDPDRDGIIAPAQGGTGHTTLQAVRNAMGLGDTTGALPIANGGTGQTTAAGVRNALGLGETTGALPIANGGTGQTTAAGVRNALGLGNTTGALPVANGGTGKSSISAGAVLVGNNTDTPSERGINSTSGGVENSDSLTTAGALFATNAALNNSIAQLRLDFTNGCNAIANALIAQGVTPTKAGDIYSPEEIVSAIITLFRNNEHKYVRLKLVNLSANYSNANNVGNISNGKIKLVHYEDDSTVLINQTSLAVTNNAVYYVPIGSVTFKDITRRISITRNQNECGMHYIARILYNLTCCATFPTSVNDIVSAVNAIKATAKTYDMYYTLPASPAHDYDVLGIYYSYTGVKRSAYITPYLNSISVEFAHYVSQGETIKNTEGFTAASNGQAGSGTMTYSPLPKTINFHPYQW